MDTKTKEGKVWKTKKITVYGEKDPTYTYIPFLECNKLMNLEIIRIPDADHLFKGKLEEFIELSDIIMQ